MHRCLYIPEILCQIISATDVEDPAGPWWDSEPDRFTLASLARTCRLFYEPASDALWQTQYNLCALVKCMPSDSWEEVAGQSLEPAELRFVRPIKPSDYIRFVSHARRVRILFVYQWAASRLSGDVVAALAGITDSPFCNLHTLITDATVLPLKHLVFLPNIATLTIEFNREEKQILSILPSLHSRCPFLKEISFDFYSAADVPAVSEHLCSWVSLDRIEAQELDDRTLIHLGSMPNLRKICFSPVQEREEAHPSFLGTFSSLRSLAFSTNGRRGCCSFMKSVGIFRIHRFTLNLHLPDSSPLHDDTTWGEFFWAVSTHCAHCSLMNIAICNGFSEFSPITLDDFKPLFLFSNLTVFEASGRDWCHIDDAFIKAMVMAWPHLQQFTVNCYSDPKTMLGSLAHLARYCKGLEMVHLSIDGTVIPPALSWPDGHLMNESVKSLYLPRSPILDPTIVAPFLLHLFPNLNRIHMEPFDLYAPKWADVLKHLLMLKEARERSGMGPGSVVIDYQAC